jgi:hypothetical protein
MAIIGMLWGYIPWKSIQAKTNTYEEKVVIEDENENREDSRFPTKATTFDGLNTDYEYEVFSKRTEKSKTYRKTDGSFVIVVYDYSIHYFDDNSWKDIDNTLNDNGENFKSSSNVFNIEYNLDNEGDGYNQSSDVSVEYKYVYDELGNITDVRHLSNGVVVLKEHYEYDSLNQLILEEMNDSSNVDLIDCDSFSNTCYTKIYQYDLRGNIKDEKTFLYNRTKSVLEIPTPYENSYGNYYDIVIEYSGGLSFMDPIYLNVGDYFDPFTTIDLKVRDMMTWNNVIDELDYKSCNPNAVNTSIEGYYLQECEFVDTSSEYQYHVVFGLLVKVGNPPTLPAAIQNHVSYTYSTNWLDQLVETNSITYDVDGIENSNIIQVYSSDIQGNPTSISNFEYDGVVYDYATFKYDGRQLTDISVFNHASTTAKITISFTYNNQGYRTSKTINVPGVSSSTITTCYHLEGDKVLVEETDKYNLIYSYDYDGSLISFYYDEVSKETNDTNDGEYFYIKNLQGDIT